MNGKFSVKLIPGFCRLSLACAIIIVQVKASEATGIYLDFEEFPVTKGSVPQDSRNWLYSSAATNDSGLTESRSSGWRSRKALPDGLHWFFEFNRNNRCYDHMYGDTYGYMEITDKGHSGKALRDVITGGRAITGVSGPCPSPPSGVQLYNRESYTGAAQHHTGSKIGSSYIYFKRIAALGGKRVTTPYSIARGSNRMSAYIYLPPETGNGEGGRGKPVRQTFQVGLFTDPARTGAHHYANFYTRGGGWTKIQIDETTNGDNSGNRATRRIPGFLQSLWQFYFTTLPNSGIATPPYEVKIDDIAFERDGYAPQNEETISNMAILFNDSDRSFEISFNDKYKNSAETHAVYELRYSFGPITNENWSSATPASIIADGRFSIRARSDGKFQKCSPYSQGVWAPFSLADGDTARLAPGRTVYFAVKDVSQLEGNGQAAVDGINGVWKKGKGGRPYDRHPELFDYARDRAALPHIKRIAYTLATN